MIVDPKRFDAPTFGQALKTPGPHGYWAYRPAPLPTSFDMPASTVMLLSDADRALGRLAGAGRLLPNPHLLLQPYMTREALASSRIEGTQASLSDVFDAQARETARGPIREVTNYIRALEHGLRRLDNLPVSKRLLCEVHAILLHDVRGLERRPGEIRSSQNWIGSPDNRPETAVFVPPPPDEMKSSFDRLERYIHAPSKLPPLVEIALIHYQFETIHPFLDGNGRLGRLLIALILVERELLPQPLLYLSAYFERRRNDYYDRLQAVRERGEMTEWLDFFLAGRLRAGRGGRRERRDARRSSRDLPSKTGRQPVTRGRGHRSGLPEPGPLHRTSGGSTRCDGTERHEPSAPPRGRRHRA